MRAGTERIIMNGYEYVAQQEWQVSNQQRIIRGLEAEINSLHITIHALTNELCERCGKYKTAHDGGCDGCRWKE